MLFTMLNKFCVFYQFLSIILKRVFQAIAGNHSESSLS